MKRHDTHPDWMVDDRGHVWRNERVFGCEHHPYGPPHDVDDEHTAVERLARCLLDELGTEAIKTVAPGVTSEQIEEARQELGMCCRGHRWRNTGRLVEVGSMEQFIHSNMRMLAGPLNDSIKRSVLLDEINRAGDYPATWQGTDRRVVIPLIVHAGTPLPRSAAAEAADEIIDGPH